ncbi:DNA polymerase epsilon catalytic subunit [Cryptosporidium ubiquitum]|uniref:DNA-directed DNA polymerase n=1 Tax=Cryptosporidium ubiquitum TaxID=857276 RepID=A0A1J4MHR0_9CRYT|nr:DNA polymerase epsilon catalytic subunit [Cryptosporidium ubiquitum]OII73551.1 DNA polymerase epsilon catalytic subunit [Cryptosporidium ubiquitum]
MKRSKTYKENWRRKFDGKSERKKSRFDLDGFSSIDKKFGINLQKIGPNYREVGYLYNVQVSSELISETGTSLKGEDLGNSDSPELIESYKERSCLNLYFINKQGLTYKTPFFFRPYFYLEANKGVDVHWMLTNLENKYRGTSVEFINILKEDLTLDNHLIGEKRELIKASFDNVKELVITRNEILDHIRKNKMEKSKNEDFELYYEQDHQIHENKSIDVLDLVSEIYEYDVQYETRVMIDNSISIGMWYDFVRWTHELSELNCLENDTSAPDLRSLAWDIETTKDPLKFPNVEKDQIMMISCMFEGQGYLITNREIVSSDISDFEYSPKKDFESFFKCINYKDEKELIWGFLKLIQTLRPHIIASYNGDNFDFPFLYERAKKYDIDVSKEWGIRMEIDHSSTGGPQSTSKTIFSGTSIIHLDCFRWVERDSYLPCGSRGLKSVTKAKLRYNPVELDPELMVPYARSNPQVLAEYSVSDAVATYFLYKTYVHRFIFALATIIPLSGEDLLRKGSGTLCEHLLMKEAFNKNILFPNKKVQETMEFYQNRPILNSTYVGGTVESLCSGVFRADIPESFSLDINTLRNLLERLDSTLKFGIKDAGTTLENIENYEEVRNGILEKLEGLIKSPKIKIEPLIYHLDVAAMYPNIILTNRLQPTAVIEETTCMKCPFSSESELCQRKMNWRWKGDVFPISKGEMERMLNHMQIETFENIKYEIGVNKKKKYGDHESDSENDEKIEDNVENVNLNSKEKIKWASLTPKQQSEILIQRMKAYCNKIYRKQTENIEETRSSIVCQRENPFYIDTVRRFRDRRYVYKGKKKEAEEKLKKAESMGDLLAVQEAQNEEVLYESLQLAHKCILNSFYGYVMRKGSRWFSMEMAAIVTWVGGNVIREARSLMEGIGRPLELDTDGIWAILPKGFPEEVTFRLKNGGKKKINYICTLLNQQVHKTWTNNQYLEYDANLGKYNVKVENSIYFEVDGPYKCFFIPASDKQNKLLKKRYAVFDFENRLRELKGFELKRRGELQLIKILQEELFPAFLKGNSKKEAYESVASISKKWLNLIDTKGKGILDDEQLFFLISESKNMSKSVQQMGNAKSMSITTARRLFEFLQNPSYIQDKNIVCKFIVSEFPKGEDKSQRAIPLSIFSTPLETRISWLSKWLRISKSGERSKEDQKQEGNIINKENEINKWNVRNILDWEYYKKRLTSTILKIVIIPAINQGVPNPLPELEVPNWVKYHSEIVYTNQQKISEYFTVVKKNNDSSELQTNIPKLSDPGPVEEVNDRTNPDIDLQTSNIVETDNGKLPEPSSNDQITKLDRKLTKRERIELFKEKGLKFWIEYHKKFWLESFHAFNLRQSELENKLKNIDKAKLEHFGKGNKTKGIEFFSEYQFLTRGKFHILDIYPLRVKERNRGDQDEDLLGFYNVVMYSEQTGGCFIVTFEFLRRFYIATNVQIQVMDNDSDGEFITKSIATGKELPRGVPYDYLTEIIISERRFQKSKSTLICDNNTVGIYEANIPLEFSILERFGNMIESNTPNVEKLLLKNGAVSDKFWSSAGLKQKILNYGDIIHWLFLSICTFEDRKCFSLVDLSKRRIYFLLGSGPPVPHNILKSELERHVREDRRLAKITQIHVNYLKTIKESLEELDQLLENLIQEFPKEPVVLLVNSMVGLEELKAHNSNLSLYGTILRGYVSGLEHEKKIIETRMVTLWEEKRDIDQNNLFSKFNWYKDSVKYSIKTLKEGISKLQLALELSKALRLPVLYLLQFEDNLTNFLYDIIYSRELHSMGLLSWGSLSSTPDLGNPRLIQLSKSDWDLRRLGYLMSTKDLNYGGYNNGTGNLSNGLDNFELDILEVVRPGIYRNYGVKLDFKQWLIIESVRNCKKLSEKYKLDDFEKGEKKILGAECKRKNTEKDDKKDILIYNLGKKKHLSNPNNKQGLLISQPLYNHSSLSTSSAFLCLEKTINKMRSVIESHENIGSIFRIYCGQKRFKSEGSDGENDRSRKEEDNDKDEKYEDGNEERDDEDEDEDEEEETSNLLFEFMVTLQERFYSWLSSPSSLLYDPALIEMTKNYSHKYFKSLEADMREMGILVVYGNIRKMVLTFNVEELKNNSIKNTGDLRAHFSKLMHILNSRELYSGISLDPSLEYKSMIQIDRTNYIRRTMGRGGLGEGLEDPYEMNLNLLNYFPVNSRKYIVSEISNFLMEPLRELRNYLKKNPNISIRESFKVLGDIVLEQFGPLSENFQNFLQAISNPGAYIASKYGIQQFEDPLNDIGWNENIREEDKWDYEKNMDIYTSGSKNQTLEENNTLLLSKNLENLDFNKGDDVPFAIYPSSKKKKGSNSYRVGASLKTIREKVNKKRTNSKDLFELPPCIGKVFSGSKSSLSLELIKLFIYIWGLDRSFFMDENKEKQYEQIIYMVCQTVEISEFNPIVTEKWKSPLIPYIIKDFVCPNCLEIEDFDFTGNAIQDEDDIEFLNNGNNNIPRQKFTWYCNHCNFSIDNEILEEKLLLEFFERLEVIQSQDILCSKCNSVQIGHMQKHCHECTGELTTRLGNHKGFHNFFSLFNSVAHYYSDLNNGSNKKPEFQGLIEFKNMYENILYI